MLMFTLVVSCLTTSNLHRFMDLTWLDINYKRKKKTVRNTNTWRINNTLLNTQQVTEEIKREMKKSSRNKWQWKHDNSKPMKVKVNHSVVSNSLRPYGLSPPAFSVHGIPGKNTGVGSYFLLQEILPTQGSNPGLPHCRQTLYWLSHQGNHKTYGMQ